jgi:GTPase SAR1 family protein
MSLNENPIAQNRAEEMGYDIWEEFVIPPFYDSMDLITAKKPRVIVGGRGCGKTSLLRYLCHQSQFSTRRSIISKSDLNHIGIYWKIDTQFAKIFTKRGLGEDIWIKAFEHMATLVMCQEVLKSIESIANSSLQNFDKNDIDSFDFSILNSFSPNVPSDFNSLKKFIRREFNYFQTWVGSIRIVEQPIFLPKHFIIELINEIRTQNLLFKDSNYFVYIDEYENLLIDQQRLINTWLKHSEMPLIFNLAMKRYSFNDKLTVGMEQLVNIHDYREYDLESFYDDRISFDLFAAEILFLRLWKHDNRFKIPIIPEQLRSIELSILKQRRSDDYRRKVIQVAKNFLPSYSIEEIASNVFTDDILNNRLINLIKDSIKQKEIKNSWQDFYLSQYPSAGVVIPALINRSLNSNELLQEISKLKLNSDNKFTGKTAWIHNNIVGCLLLIYEPLGRLCPIYSGFEAFCMMSRTNIRHFLELCNKSLVNENIFSSEKNISSISIKAQTEATKQASTSFLKEIKSFGVNGNSLHTFVLRLGTYFKFAHKRLTQSEPEQNHFYIKGSASVEISKFIEDAIKWSVLYENKITKQKGGSSKIEAEDFEYILNPIYAPYFHISFRKKRSVGFKLVDLNILIFGDFKKFEKYLNKTITDWKILPSLNEVNLFSNNADIL